MDRINFINKTLKIAGAIVVTIFSIFFILAIFIYIPPVQKWISKGVANKISQETNTQIHIGYVRLSFPLDLSLNNIQTLQGKDTLLDVRTFRVRVGIFPLLSKKISLKKFVLKNARINTKNLINNMRIKGEIGYISMDLPNSFSLDTFNINNLLLKNNDISIIFNNTVRQEEEKEETGQAFPVIMVNKIKIENTSIKLGMPNDSMRISTIMDKGEVHSLIVDSKKQKYYIQNLSIKRTQFQYDIPYKRYSPDKFDTNHIAINNLTLQGRKIGYIQGKLDATITKLSFSERCGLELRHLSSRIVCDSTRIHIPYFQMETPSSSFSLKANVPWKSLKQEGEDDMNVVVEGKIGGKDLLVVLGKSVKKYLQFLPKELLVQTHIQGNVRKLLLKRCQAQLGKALKVSVSGELDNLLSEKNRRISTQYKIRLRDARCFRKLLPEGLHIPSHFLLRGNIGMDGNKITTLSSICSGKGFLKTKGYVDIKDWTYNIMVSSQRFPLKIYFPDLPVSPLTATVHLKGKGFELMDRNTILESSVKILQLQYDCIPLDSINLTAYVKKNTLHGILTSRNKMLNAQTQYNATINRNFVSVTVKGDIDQLAFEHLTNGQDSTHLMMSLKLDGYRSSFSDKMGLKGLIENLNIIMPNAGIPADSVGFHLETSKDSTWAFVHSGDLVTKLYSRKEIGNIINSISHLITHTIEQLKTAKIDQMEFKRDMPGLSLTFEAGQNNPLYQYLRMHGYSYQQANLYIRAYPENGLQGDFNITNLKTGNLLLDKAHVHLSQDSAHLKLKCSVENTSKENPNKFTAGINGELLSNGFYISTSFIDSQNKSGMDFGIQGLFSKDQSLTMHIVPENSIIAYRRFTVNKDNYFTIGPEQQILANIDLLADDETGLKIHADKKDSINDIAVTLSKININELCSVLPYLPRMGGRLGGDIHILRQDACTAIAGELNLEQFKYETFTMGDFSADFSCLPKSGNEYYLNALVQNEDKEVAVVDGSYKNADGGVVDASIILQKFPCWLLNAFLPSDGTLALEGYTNGEIKLTGPTDQLVFNGNIVPDSLIVFSPLYGINIAMENKEISIENSRIHLDNQTFFSQGNKNPLSIDGWVDFKNMDNILLDLSAKAKNFQIINAERTKSNVLYGKVYADINTTIKGSTNFMIIKGDLDILKNTNMTYVMKEGMITESEWLNGLVEFVDFSDTTTIKEPEPVTGNMMMSLNIQIAETTKMHCELNNDGSNYVDCRGGGNLNMKYLPSGDISLLGTLKLHEGEMKYELPFIPLKTFNLEDENYITFTGSPYNPNLYIKAMETTRASVSNDGNSTRMVTFNVGVAISQTLENMGLQFLIEAPEDLNVQNELASMSDEDRGRMAVSLLATGMYLSSTNKSSFKANNALNTFLQSEIQTLAGNALKTIDLSVGVEGSTTSSGNAQTDYSFQFAKHLWNDRVTFIIGGKVSAGAKDNNENQSFIDNISLEYRLDHNSTRHLRLFYDHDSQDPLEGTYNSAGAGFVWRNKANTFGELFIKPRKKTAASDSKK